MPFAEGLVTIEIAPWIAAPVVSSVTLTMPSHARPHRRLGLRTLVERFVFILVAVVLLRTWLVEGLLVPYRVTGGSMAETLLGSHRKVTCGDCGHRFVCQADRHTDRQADRLRTTCPNCGRVGHDTPSVAAGDRLMIDKSAFHLRRPRRWEVVAFRGPHHPGKIQVKRVVGLPGESIRIRHGDVYADGVLQRKTLSQQRAMAVLVHDANSQPGPAPPRWQGPDAQSGWGSAEGRFAHPHTSGQRLDPLEYRHRLRWPDPQHPFRPAAVTDLCGYNQTYSRRDEDVSAVSDLLLSLRLARAEGQGFMAVMATDGREQLEVRVYPNRTVYETLHKGRVIPSGAGDDVPPIGDGLTVEVSLIDSQLLVAFNGHTVGVPYRYHRSEDGSAKPTPRPLAIVVKQLGVEICDLRLYRDVYYTAPGGLRNRWGLDKPVKLGKDEYFVLGDNSPISEDSRTWPEGPAVAGKLLVGKPLVVHYPARALRLGRWVFQVPDPAGIRYIR